MSTDASAAISARPSRAGGWTAHLLGLAIVLAGLLTLFAHDTADIATIWWTSSTYEHCLVILPIIGWLIWQRVPVLATLQPRGWAAPLTWVAVGAFGWLLGEAAGVAVVRHISLVIMIQGAIAALLGRGATAALVFPLFYAFFLVPAGDLLVPPLQTLTARICMVLLELVRVPARLDGVFITTPGGWFKVAEACSGVKFLIAMIALSVLVANLGFLSWRRRGAFLLLGLVAPVMANGIRAFGTIWVAQYLGAKVAGSFDHIIYGWIFFAIVIAIVLAIGWRFFDRPADAPAVDRESIEREAARQRSTMPLALTALLVLMIAATAPIWSAAAIRSGAEPVPASVRLPDVAGWARVMPVGGMPWRPRFDGADRLLTARYRDASGAEVDMAVALYATQGRGRSLVGYGHGAVDPDGRWSWAADLPAPPDGQAERIEAPGAVSRTVMSFYMVGHEQTGSAARVKLETLRHHLLGGDQRAVALLISSENTHGGRPAVEHFLAALGPVDRAIEQISAGR